MSINSLADDVELILDLSRLLSRGLHSMPTGVDRVEMAYARTLLDIVGDRLSFAAVNPVGLYGRLDFDRAVAFLDALETRWNDGRGAGWLNLRLAAFVNLVRLWPRPPQRESAGRRRFLIQASPNHLHQPDKVRAKIRREGARFICVVFDLIPIDFPEYARPNGAVQHRARVETMVGLADGLVAISQDIADSVAHYVPTDATGPVIRAALLGVDGPAAQSGAIGEAVLPAAAEKPYFLIVSTIEPRKNHLLLLHLWRKMVEERGPEATPQLIVVGRRGWENENIVDMLERCDAIRDNVTELSGLSDKALFQLMRGARAVLLPSFAEGFGMPVAEALSQGTPVICSDLPALREAGAGIAEYIDPIDGAGWLDAILDYAKLDSPRRAEQLARITSFRTPTWRGHIDQVLDLIADIDRDGRAQDMPIST